VDLEFLRHPLDRTDVAEPPRWAVSSTGSRRVRKPPLSQPPILIHPVVAVLLVRL
jgi:hypothetical protein